MREKTNLIKFIQLWGIVFLAGLGIIIVIVECIVSYNEFMIIADHMQEDHIAFQKKTIKDQVEHVVDTIVNEIAKSESLTKTEVEKRTYEAWSIAQNIYQQNKTARSDYEIQKMILDALRPIRFGHGNGYYFATRLDGINILFADRPEIEGTDFLQVQDIDGKYVNKDMIKIVRQSTEGFYEYHWTKPGAEGNNHKKIAFIKLFEPYDWFIGTGLYTDDIKEQLKADLLLKTSKMRFGKEGYIFINRLNGDALVSNGKLFSGTKKLWEEFPKYPEKLKMIFEKEYKAAIKPDGGYIHYSWIKLTTQDKESPKISFIYGIPGLQWLVGAGVYIDDIEAEIAMMQEKLSNRARNKILYFILLTAGVILVFWFILRQMGKKLDNDYNLFFSFFNRAAKSNKIIEREQIQFAELDQMAKTANMMLKDRSQAENQIKRLATVVEQSRQIVVITDLKGNVEYVNPAFEEITGYSFAEVKNENLRILKSDEHDLDFYENLWSTILSGKTWLGTFCNKKKDGTLFYEKAVIFPITDDMANIINFAAVKMDITHEKLLEKQLQQTQRVESIGTLAGGIAHDFNNILFPILGHTEMLLEDIPEDSELRESLDEVYNGAVRAKKLVEQILTFSRQERDELALIKIQPVIKEALKLIRASIPATIEIIQNIKPDCGVIKADPTQIHQIIMNLATNAYHSMEERGGKLSVSLEEIKLNVSDITTAEMTSGAYACLTVADTGKGMDKETSQKIFDPFFTTKKVGKGTGLGLSVVHGIVKNMGGDVQVYSKPGKGSKFKLYFPVGENVLVKSNIHAYKTVEGGEEHILLVDDEKNIVNVVTQTLERLGYQVTSYTSSLNALEIFSAAPDKFDLVITDLAMPNMPGDKFAVELIKKRPDIPILLCTGFSEVISEEKMASLGIKGFLLKPIIKKDLACKIREILDR